MCWWTRIGSFTPSWAGRPSSRTSFSAAWRGEIPSTGSCGKWVVWALGSCSALLSPVLLASTIGRKLFGAEELFHDREVVFLPASSQPHEWETFDLLSLTSQPPQASFGDFCGCAPSRLVARSSRRLELCWRSPAHAAEEVEALPDWRSVYLPHQGGADHRSDDDLRRLGGGRRPLRGGRLLRGRCRWKHDLRLLSRYLLGVVLGRWKPVMSD